MTTSHLYSLCSFLLRSVLRTKPMRCGNQVYCTSSPRWSAHISASWFSNPLRFLCEKGRLLGSAQTRNASRSWAAAGCAKIATAIRIATLSPNLCTSVLSLGPSRQEHAVGAGLLIRVKLIDKILDVRVLTPCRHDANLAGIPIRHHINETLLRDILQQARCEGASDGILTMAGVAGCMKCAPPHVGSPVRDAESATAFVDLAAVYVVILLVVAGRVRRFGGSCRRSSEIGCVARTRPGRRIRNAGNRNNGQQQPSKRFQYGPNPAVHQAIWHEHRSLLSNPS